MIISFCRNRCTAQDVYACISNMTSSSGNLFCRSFPTLAGQSRQADWCSFRCELYDYKASKVVIAQRSLEAFQTPTQTHLQNVTPSFIIRRPPGISPSPCPGHILCALFPRAEPDTELLRIVLPFFIPDADRPFYAETTEFEDSMRWI